MNFDDLLRDYARRDLQRFCPAAHYWLRDHNPIADRELVEPLLIRPVEFGLTPLEHVAADALGKLTTYTITSRAIWDAAYPARDTRDTTPAPGTTFNQEREIWGRREVFRSSALVYARLLDDAQLIELYGTPLPAPANDTATPASVVAVDASNARPRARRDLLAPVIESAQKECPDPFDAPAVWASLVRMADARKLPLLGISDEGIKWQDSNDQTRFLKIKNLRERLLRSMKKSSVERDKAR